MFWSESLGIFSQYRSRHHSNLCGLNQAHKGFSLLSGLKGEFWEFLEFLFITSLLACLKLNTKHILPYTNKLKTHNS
jgi:hypothetical protein